MENFSNFLLFFFQIQFNDQVGEKGILGRELSFAGRKRGGGVGLVEAGRRPRPRRWTIAFN